VEEHGDAAVEPSSKLAPEADENFGEVQGLRGGHEFDPYVEDEGDES
jgi:hypothetical protein